MAKSAADAVLDGLLDVVATATAQIACSAQPTSYAEATSTYALADVTIDSGDFTKGNGDTNGRKVTVAQQAGVDVDTTGTATHVALVITASSTLLYVTTCTSQALTSGNSVTFPAWDIEVADPT
jgi:hypothetical protein